MIPLPFRFEDQPLLWTVTDVYLPDECREIIEFIERCNPGLPNDNPLYRDQDRVMVEVAIFQHKLRHEGCVVRRGTKYAMRTELVFEAPEPIGFAELNTDGRCALITSR